MRFRQITWVHRLLQFICHDRLKQFLYQIFKTASYGQLTIFELQQQLRDVIAPRFGEILANEKIPLMEMAGSMSALGEKVHPFIVPYFDQLGVRLIRFIITSVTLPDEVAAHFDNISRMNMVGDMKRYTEFQTAQAIGDGGALLVTPGAAGQGETTEAKLQTLKTIFEKGLIDEDEYQAKKAVVLAAFG
ncbi:MAG: SPFH domain-containing protein [Zoogloeaceae bacterium]|nr:SPFH domain-containing protein [Zoogloeaceae bacterium]